MTSEQKSKKVEALIDEIYETDDEHRKMLLARKALRLDPQSSEALVELGRCYLHRGKVKLAEKTFQKALVIEENVWAIMWLGHIHYRRWELEEAEDKFQQTRKLLAEYSAPLWAIADVRWRAGDIQGSEDYYRQAVALERDDASSLARLGRFLIETDRREEGEFYLREALTYRSSESTVAKWAKRYLGINVQSTNETLPE